MTGTNWADALTRPRRGPAADPRADGELLRLFAAGRDETAFAALVRRHGALVWGVAVRHAADRHAAEDAFQATFFALARTAARLRTDTPLAGWLHTVARRLAGRTRRRPAAPLGDPATAADPLEALSARELLTALDAEIDRLPDRYRLPLILCGLDGLTRDEAAERLGWPAGSVKGRLERGRELLRQRLAKRGIELPAVWAAAVGSAVPAALVSATPAAAAEFVATGRGGAAAALAAEVGRRGARAWVAAGVACAVMVLGGGWALTAGPAAADPPAKPEAAKPEAAKSPADDDDDTVPVRVRWKGKPAAGVKVWAYPAPRSAVDKPATGADPVVSGPDGIARIPAEATGEYSFNLFARDDAGRIGGTNHQRMLAGAGAVTIDLYETTTLTGRVTGTDGRPLAGVKVSPLSFRSAAGDSPVEISSLPWERGAAERATDADGRFAVPGLPVGLLMFVSVRADGYGEQRAAVRTDKPLTLTLERAGAVRVTFRGADAAATKGLDFTLRRDPPRRSEPSAYEPAADGAPRFFSFHFGEFDGSPAHVAGNLPPGEYTFSASGGGPAAVWVKQAKVVVKPAATAELTLDLTPLAKTSGRIVDAGTGEPVAGAELQVSPADGTSRSEFPFSTVQTAADGRFDYYAPPGQGVVLNVVRTPDSYLPPGYYRREATSPEAKLTAAGHTFPDLKLRPAAAFTATVVDRDGKPVRALAYADVDGRAGRGAVRAGKDGVVVFKQRDPNDLIALRVRRGDAVNVPEAVEVGAAGNQRITVSPANACYLAGRITDPAGKPIPGATVAVWWMVYGVGKRTGGGSSTIFERLTTDADGKYKTSALWPTDTYWVHVTADGFAEAESAHQHRVEAKTITADLKLVPANAAVTGRVVDLAGKPLAGVTVFNRGDGERPVETTTADDGTFRLRGYRAGPGFVFAKHPGYRTAVAPADPGGEPVTLTLRTTADPPAPLPDATTHTAAVNELAKRALDFLWTNRDKLGGYERNVFTYVLRSDRATAAGWAAGKPDWTARLKAAEAEEAAFEVAKTDPDEAVARLADRKGRDGFYLVAGLANRLRPTHPRAAARLVEDMVQRARAADMPNRALWLGQAGYLAARCGDRDAGRKLAEEAAALVEPLGTKDRTGFDRGWTIAYLAPFDPERTVKLLAADPDADHYNRYLAEAIDRLAAFDPAAAERLLDRFRGRALSFDQYEGRMYLAYRYAATDPDKAQKLIAGVTKEQYRTLGYLKLAELIAGKDRQRAWRVLDAALADYDSEPANFDSWIAFGGRPALLAVAAITARDIGYPNASEFVTRALLYRPATQGDPAHRGDQNTRVALALSFTDPAAARRVLEAAVPADTLLKQAATGTRDSLFIAAFVLPERALPAVEARLSQSSRFNGLSELAESLTAKNKLDSIAGWVSLPKTNGHWED